MRGFCFKGVESRLRVIVIGSLCPRPLIQSGSLTSYVSVCVLGSRDKEVVGGGINIEGC